MDKPKVSIIVPVYKTAKYLNKCVDSILNQTLDEIEVILVCDGVDKEYKICDEYSKKDDRIIVIKDIKKGLGGARNAGIDIAKGDYIAFVDSDDWVEKDTYKTALSYFNNEIDIVIFGVNVVGDPSLIKKPLVKYMTLKYSKTQVLDEDKIFTTNVSAWNKIYKKSIIDKYNLRFPIKMQYEDFPFYFQYCLVSKFAYFLNEPFYNYLQRDDSGMAQTTNKNFNYIKDHILGCKFLYDELNKKGLYEINKTFFSKIYSRWIKIGLKYCSKNDKINYLNLAYQTLEQIKTDDSIGTLKYLRKKDYKKVIKDIVEESKVYLFGILPIITIKKFSSNKTKIYLFGVLLFKIKSI